MKMNFRTGDFGKIEISVRTSPDGRNEVQVDFFHFLIAIQLEQMTDLSAESLEGNASLLEEFVDESFFDNSAKDDAVELTNMQLPLWENISPGELNDLLAKENAGKTLPWTKLLNKQWGSIGNAL